MTHTVSSRLAWTLGYAFGIAKETAGGTTIFRQYDRRHAFSISSNYQFAPTWHLYLSWRFHTGEPRNATDAQRNLVTRWGYRLRSTVR